MRKLILMGAVSMLVMPVAVQADANDELFADRGVLAGSGAGGKVYYKGGTNLAFPDAGFKLKINTQLQSKYTYQDKDSENRVKNGGDPVEDRSNFRIRRARIVLKGSALDKEVSFKLQNDFVGTTDAGSSGRRASDLRDAWLQWNHSKEAKLRFGQMKVPFSRQQNSSSSKLQFIDRSIADGFFNHGRNVGAMLHGKVGELGYKAGVYNGESDGEGRNRQGQDTELLGAFMVDYTNDAYGSRSAEGDPGNTEETGYTFGVSALVDEANISGAKVEEFSLSGDVGVKCHGFSAQAEIYFRQLDFDGVSTEREDTGLYAQVGYFFVPKEWEVAGRFSAVFPDDDFSAADEITEFTVVVGRYYSGHNLKLQTGVTFENTAFKDSALEDITDFRYDLQMSMYM